MGDRVRDPGPARERIFSNAMTFAQKLARDITTGNTDHTNGDALAIVNGLLDRAAAAAFTPQQQVNYRMARARLASANHDQAMALKLLQEILSDPQWRSVAVAEGDSGALDEFGRWLRRGPRLAEVESVERQDLVGERRYREFSVSYGPANERALG